MTKQRLQTVRYSASRGCFLLALDSEHSRTQRERNKLENYRNLRIEVVCGLYRKNNPDLKTQPDSVVGLHCSETLAPNLTLSGPARRGHVKQIKIKRRRARGHCVDSNPFLGKTSCQRSSTDETRKKEASFVAGGKISNSSPWFTIQQPEPFESKTHKARARQQPHLHAVGVAVVEINLVPFIVAGARPFNSVCPARCAVEHEREAERSGSTYIPSL